MLFRLGLSILAVLCVGCTSGDGTSNVAHAQSASSEKETQTVQGLGPAFRNERVGTAGGPVGATGRTTVADFEDGALPTLDEPTAVGSFVEQSRDTELRIAPGGPGSSTRCLEIEQRRGSYAEDGLAKFASLTWMLPDEQDPGRHANVLQFWIRGERDSQGRAPETIQMGARSYLGDGTPDSDRSVRTVFEKSVEFASEEWSSIAVRIDSSLQTQAARSGGYDLALQRPSILPNSDAVYWQLLAGENSVRTSSVFLDELEWFYANPKIATHPHVSVRWAEADETVRHPVMVWNTHPTRTRNLQIRGRGWRRSLGADWKGNDTRVLDSNLREVSETGPLAPSAAFLLWVELGVPETNFVGTPIAEGAESVYQIDVFEDENDIVEAAVREAGNAAMIGGDERLSSSQRVSAVIRTLFTSDKSRHPEASARPVNDLEVADRGSSWAELRWTSPLSGDSTLSYALRYSTEPITDETSWNSATPVEGLPPLFDAGDLQHYSLRGLNPNAGYHVGLRTYDADGNGSSVARAELRTLSAETDNVGEPGTPPSSETPRVPSACDPLGPPTGGTITVTPSQASRLRDIIRGAVTGTTIILEPGLYDLSGGDRTSRLVFSRPGVTLRSSTGYRESVVLDGNWETNELIYIEASDVTIADITIRRAGDHIVHAVPSSSGGSVEGIQLLNLALIDGGEQSIKVSSSGDNTIDFGSVKCCHIELTDEGREHVSSTCYTGGLDFKGTDGWIVANNTFKGYWCDEGLSEHAIHFWAGCRGTIVENNVIVDCARGIGFGLTENRTGRVFDSPSCDGNGTIGHYGGIIRNNVVCVLDDRVFATESGFDVGIGLEQACGTIVAHNTVASNQEPFSSIEFRFERSDVRLINNLVTHNIRRRSGASGELAGNVTEASLDIFEDPASGDLHLKSSATVARNRGVALDEGIADLDLDGGVRDRESPDVGADEQGVGTIIAPAGLANNGGNGANDAGDGPDSGSPGDEPEPVVNQELPPPPLPDPGPVDRALLTPDDFEYAGAFRLPDTRSMNLESKFWNGGWHPTFHLEGDPDGDDDGFPGAIIMVGNEREQLSAMISIPRPVISNEMEDLNITTILNPFADMTGGKKQDLIEEVGSPIFIGGMQLVDAPYVDEPMLVTNLFRYYNVAGRNFNGMVCGRPDWSNPQAVGRFHVGVHDADDRYGMFHAQKTSGYMMLAPQWWADRYTRGMPLLTGLQITQGVNSSTVGPSLYAVKPWDDQGSPPAPNTNLAAIPLMAYPHQHAEPTQTNACWWKGGAFIDTGSKYGLMIVGRHGHCERDSEGRTPYGDGTDFDHACTPNKGYHCGPYTADGRLYNPADLARVAQGELDPWEIRHYRTLRLNDFVTPTCSQKLGGVAYDRSNQLLYVLQLYADSSYSEHSKWPIFHVFRVRD